MGRLVFIAFMLAGAWQAHAQPAPPTSRPNPASVTPSRSVIRRQAPGEQNQIDSSQALFAVLAAINAVGYDDQNDAVSTHPFRHALRAQLAASAKLDSAYALRRFYRDHALKDPKAELSRYISYALLIDGPPDFGYRDPDMLRPADASSLEGLSPLLAAFYREANLDELWQRAQPAYDQMIELYHAPVTNTVQQVNAYLRNTTNGYLGRRFLIYVDLLGAPNQAQTRLYGDDYFVVVTPSAAPQVEGVRHAYLHYLIDPLGFKFAEDIKKKHALGDYAQGAPLLDSSFKDDFVLLTTECLIKAVEARLDRRPAAVEQALKEGFVLTPALAEQLAIFEKQEVAMRLYLPTMIAALDFRKEEKRLENVEFATTREQRVVRAAQTVKAPELTGAARTLADAEQAYTDRDLDRAKTAYLRALEETTEQPMHAKSYYGLARIAVLQRDPETGDRLFRKVLELEPDPETKSWSLLYLARLADSQGEREEAQQHYKAVLEVEGAPESVRKAAEKGVGEAFVNSSGGKK